MRLMFTTLLSDTTIVMITITAHTSFFVRPIIVLTIINDIFNWYALY